MDTKIIILIITAIVCMIWLMCFVADRTRQHNVWNEGNCPKCGHIWVPVLKQRDTYECWNCGKKVYISKHVTDMYWDEFTGER